MLILTRKPGQAIQILPEPGLSVDGPVGGFFAEGPIEIVVRRVTGKQVRLGITAHAGLKVVRAELEVREGLGPRWRVGGRG